MIIDVFSRYVPGWLLADREVVRETLATRLIEETCRKEYPYLLRGLSITASDQVWGIDRTYIRLRRTWMYLVALIDWFSRYVVEWQLGDTMAQL